ncbi:hypothetical protein GQX74_010138 [Glossina fuscipes]|nr:hypothetical protein GQX74_010138 [Glossina fuscipes]
MDAYMQTRVTAGPLRIIKFSRMLVLFVIVMVSTVLSSIVLSHSCLDFGTRNFRKSQIDVFVFYKQIYLYLFLSRLSVVKQI